MYYSYYRDPKIPRNDYEDMSVPLQLNCACAHTVSNVKARSVRQDYYLVYLVEGEVAIRAPFSAVLSPGDMVVFEPNVPFAFDNFTDILPTSTHYSLHFTGNLARSLLLQLGIATGRVYRVGESDRIGAGMQRLFDAFIRRDEFFDVESAERLLSLLTIMARSIKRKSDNESRERLRASVDYMHRNYNKVISVSSLAELEHISESRYRAVFSTLFGVSPHEYLTEIRMNAARDLLSDSELEIFRISESVGIADGRYFSRLFRKRFGSTPREYRQKMRGSRK